MIKDQNGKRVTKSVRQEADGSWSANVWCGGLNGLATDVRRVFGYATKRAALFGDISESSEKTNARLGG